MQRVAELAGELVAGAVVELTPGEEVDTGVRVARQAAIERAQIVVDGLAGVFILKALKGAFVAHRADKLAGQQALQQRAMG